MLCHAMLSSSNPGHAHPHDRKKLDSTEIKFHFELYQAAPAPHAETEVLLYM